MQVLENSKVDFVSVVGVSFLISFRICFWCFFSSRSYCLTFGRKKKPSVVFKPWKRVLLAFLEAVGRGGLGSSFFPFLWFCIGGSVWATIFTGVQPPAQALRAVRGPHGPCSPGWYL